MRRVQIGDVSVSRLCIGGNPFSGFSHQGRQRSREMVEYFTPERVHRTLRAAEGAGINTFVGRTDDHIMGIIRDYWDAGGTIQWFAQVSPEHDKPDSWKKWLKAAAELEPAGMYIHGGVVDFWYSQGLLRNFHEALDMMRDTGAAAGFAGHDPSAHEWIRDNLDADFQMCSHYNPTDRSGRPEHNPTGEQWLDEDRERMLDVIATIAGPVVHYKVFAAGNKPIIPAFRTMARAMRPGDVACVGVFPKDDPQMLATDVALFEQYVESKDAHDSTA